MEGKGDTIEALSGSNLTDSTAVHQNGDINNDIDPQRRAHHSNPHHHQHHPHLMHHHGQHHHQIEHHHPIRMPLHIARDPTQPRSGSISEVHKDNESLTDEADEETDVFPPTLNPRQRSHSCPENRLLQRKLKIRSFSRPPTPPPMDVDEDAMANHFSKMTVMDKIHVQHTDLPPCIPENAKN